MRILTAQEVKELPEGTIVYMRKGTDWRTSKYRVVVKDRGKFLVSVHTNSLRIIKDRKAFHYETD